MKVRYRAKALEDVDGIYRWLNHHSTNAEKVEAAILGAADWLGEHAEVGTMTDERDVRRWPMPQFRYAICYRISSPAYIDILRVIDGRQVRDLNRLPR